jgi:regulator of RNase E activity RraA
MADENQNHPVRGKVGFRVHPQWQRPDAALLDAFKDIATPQVADSMSRLGAMDGGIRSVWPSPPLIGSALTVWLHSGDNLMLHKALSLAVPNDILVINTQTNTVNSPFGEMIAASAKKIGILGLIIDGTVRDSNALEAMQFPVYSRGLCPNGCNKDGGGEVGAIIACGGVAVRPGDIIIADRDGVTVVPLVDAPEVAKLSAEKVSSEEKRAAEIRRGVLIRPEIDEQLRALKAIV